MPESGYFKANFHYLTLSIVKYLFHYPQIFRSQYCFLVYNFNISGFFKIPFYNKVLPDVLSCEFHTYTEHNRLWTKSILYVKNKENHAVFMSHIFSLYVCAYKCYFILYTSCILCILMAI